VSGAAKQTDAAIEVAGVSKKFGAKMVLDGLDLSVRPGENYVVMGLSGTGKSVTLKIIAGLIAPDAGTVRVAGIDVVRAKRRDVSKIRESLGFLFQGAALIKWMSARENVELPLLEAGVPKEEAAERAQKVLAEVGLSDAADQMPEELSGGQRKRVGFARAVVHRPKVILYDEPTTGLDPITKRTIDDLISRGRDDYGTTGIVVSHDLRSAVQTGNRIGLLYEGRIVVQGTPDEFLASDHEVVRKFLQDAAPVTGRTR
jgi:phospholipid/cholesterol/gamma-HCH transport system ATP-binding protein